MDENSGALTCDNFNYSNWTLDDINDERLEVETLFTNAKGIATSVTSSLISTCSSILVIYIIMRSAKGLRDSVYHRILFGMSVFAILQSLAIAFVTLPMPKDMIYRQFQGLVLGSKFTCRVQGFSLSLGSISGVMYNVMLSIYHLCSIRYDMPDDVFSKRLEPWLHSLSIFSGTLIAVLLRVADGFNPNPTQSSWCTATSYPYYCSTHVYDYEKQKFLEFGGIFITVFSFTALIILLSSMGLIVAHVRRQERDSANDYAQDDNNNNGTEPPRVLRPRRNRPTASNNLQRRIQEQHLLYTKTISRQAWTYTIINLYNHFMIFTLPMIRNLTNNAVLPTWWQVLILVMRPLQGLFNCIIFIYHKVNSLQKNDPSLEFWPALKMVLRGEEGQERIISDLTLVRHHNALSQISFAGHMSIEEDVDDESDEDTEEKDDEEDAATRSHSNSKSAKSNMEHNDDANKNDVDDHHHRGDLCPPTSGMGIVHNSNTNATVISRTNGPPVQAEQGNIEEEREFYQHRIQSTSGSAGLDDGQGSSQDLSGFHSSSQLMSIASDSMSISLESRHLERNDGTSTR